MTYPSWPVELPRPAQSDYTAQQQDARLRRQSDAGPSSFRRRFTSASTNVGMSVLLTADQRAVFENFFEGQSAKGAKLFWMPDPTRDGWPIWLSDGTALLMSDGTPLLLAARWLVSFGDQLPTETVVGVRFRKAFNVQVMP